jgi:hypothetical protein
LATGGKAAALKHSSRGRIPADSISPNPGIAKRSRIVFVSRLPPEIPPRHFPSG